PCYPVLREKHVLPASWNGGAYASCAARRRVRLGNQWEPLPERHFGSERVCPGSRMVSLARVPLLCALLGLELTACQVGAKRNGASGDAASCKSGGPLGAPRTDLGSLQQCCQSQGGAAHCLSLPGSVPGAITGALATCSNPGEYCVPDEFIT